MTTLHATAYVLANGTGDLCQDDELDPFGAAYEAAVEASIAAGFGYVDSEIYGRCYAYESAISYV